MEKKLKKSVQCAGRKLDGTPCTSKTLSPTGLCPRHRGFRSKSDNPKAHSGKNPLTVDSIESLGSGPMSEEAFGYSDPRPWEGSKSFGDVDSYSRPELEGHRGENWEVPEIREAARRYGMVVAHLNEMTTKMNQIQDEITRRLKKQKGVELEAAKNGREVATGDKASALAGEYTFSERGEDTVKLTLTETPGRFNASEAKSVIPKEELPRYQTLDVNTRRVPKEYRAMFDKEQAPDIKLDVKYAPTEGVGTDYATSYDAGKLKHWGTGRLAEEYYRLRDVHQSYNDLSKADAGYLGRSLPDGIMTATDETGELELKKQTKRKATFQKKDFIAHVNTMLASDDPAVEKEGQELKKLITNNAVNSNSVQVGDKKYNTNYYDTTRNNLRVLKWGELDYV